MSIAALSFVDGGGRRYRKDEFNNTVSILIFLFYQSVLEICAVDMVLVIFSIVCPIIVDFNKEGFVTFSNATIFLD